MLRDRISQFKILFRTDRIIHYSYRCFDREMKETDVVEGVAIISQMRKDHIIEVIDLVHNELTANYLDYTETIIELINDKLEEFKVIDQADKLKEELQAKGINTDQAYEQYLGCVIN